MPTYTYTCDKCSEGVEYLLKISERDSKEGNLCPHCNDGHLTKIITPVAFGDPVKMGLSGKHGGMKEVLQKIHARAPGSKLNETSTINKI